MSHVSAGVERDRGDSAFVVTVSCTVASVDYTDCVSSLALCCEDEDGLLTSYVVTFTSQPMVPIGLPVGAEVILEVTQVGGVETAVANSTAILRDGELWLFFMKVTDGENGMPVYVLPDLFTARAHGTLGLGAPLCETAAGATRESIRVTTEGANLEVADGSWDAEAGVGRMIVERAVTSSAAQIVSVAYAREM